MEVSLPAREEWIEIFIILLFVLYVKESLPAREEWIEISQPTSMPP